METGIRKAAGLRDRLKVLLEPVMARSEREGGLAVSRNDTGATPLPAPLSAQDVAVYKHLVRSFDPKQQSEL